MSDMALDSPSNASNDDAANAALSDGLPLRIQPQPLPQNQGWMSPRKRRRSFDAHDHPVDPERPLKRRQTTFNATYLSFFNSHVIDVISGSPHDHGHKLAASQIGVISWTSAEKDALFAAVSRLGRDDLPRIAAQIHTKTALEVKQYLMLLQDASLERRGAKAKSSGTVTLLHHPAAIEVDQDLCNALEAVADDLSLRQQAHEEAVEQHRWGDTCWVITPAVARNMEVQLRRHDPDIQPFSEFFVTTTWLQLSERVFMNAAIEDCNWRSVSEERPAMRTTALEDFYGLVKSITRRLLATTLIMANSRLRRMPQFKLGSVRMQDVKAARLSLGMPGDSRKFWATAARRLRLNVFDDEELGDEHIEQENVDHEGQPTQVRKDVITDESADDSSQASYDPRPDNSDCRVEQQGYDSEDAQGQEEDDEEPLYLSYNKVEELLGFPTNTGDNRSPEVSDDSEDDGDDDDDDELAIDSEDSDVSTSPEHNIVTKTSQPQSPGPTTSSPQVRASTTPALQPPEHYTIDTVAVEKDLEEAIYHSAIDFAGTTRAKDALRARIAAEHTLHSQADARDAAASRIEEARLWAVLRDEELAEETGGIASRAQSVGPMSTEDEGFTTDGTTASGVKSRGTRKPGVLALDTGSVGAELETNAGSDWRVKIKYCSEWELKARRREQQRQRDAPP